MCGIVGYIGHRDATGVVLEGLQRLEYRGYDSAGLAVLDPAGALQIRREAGRLQRLVRLLEQAPARGTVAIGHTRWATHGPPSRRNAHPHTSPDGRLVVVQNGIVENFAELRAWLQARGYTFASDTDTEVIAHLIHYYFHGGENGGERDGGGEALEAAVRAALSRLQGPSAVAVLSRDHPDRLLAARLGHAGGVVIGWGEGEMYLASDIPALLGCTRRVQFLENQQMAILTRDGAAIRTLDGRPVDRPVVQVNWDPAAVEKGEYPHFMLKEIFEQGQSIAATLAQRLDFGSGAVSLPSLHLSPDRARRLRKVTIVACGTSYYAGLVGRLVLERLARIPTEVDYASEYRYREPLIGPEEMVLAITQSGETVDTLAALEEARARGAFTAAIVNVVGSQADRMCHGAIHMHAGPEIGVASTKAFTTSLVDLVLLGLYLAQARQTLAEPEQAALVQDLARLPGLVGEVLEEARASGRYAELARDYGGFANFLYLGRGLQYPIAREGALKLKEISYIHAEGYPAGEMKHGPIALIDGRMPTVALAPRDGVYEKMVSQIEQVKARGGAVLAVVHREDRQLAARVDRALPIPQTHPLLTPVLSVIPLQLFAYHVAVGRGLDVDRPRNLAKSVTVE